MTDDLKIDTKIIDKIGEIPGTTPHRIATTLIGNWSATWTKTRIERLAAQGRIRIVKDQSGRSKLYLPDAPALEA